MAGKLGDPAADQPGAAVDRARQGALPACAEQENAQRREIEQRQRHLIVRDVF